MKVTVLGAGVIGVTSAYFLAKAGHQVTVIDKNPDSALSCSKANGGQLSYSHVETWAAKDSIFSIIKAAFLPNSFLSISNPFSHNFISWFYEFYKNSANLKSYNNSQKLFDLSLYSRDVLSAIIKEENINFDYQNNGILHFYRKQKKLDSAIANLKDFKGSYKVLNAEECVKKEPTLIKLLDNKKLAGGIFYEIDASGNSFLFTKALEKICREKYNVNFEYNITAKNIFTNRKKITGINSNKGVLTADKYVIACGSGGNKLLKGIGVNTKIYPLKGYSLSIKADEEYIAPKIALSDVENKIVYSRLGNIFRVAGTLEIGGFNKKNNSKNLHFLSGVVSNSFSDFGNFNEVVEWSGFRPFRPNSIPLICEVKKYGNLFLNIGHGSLGWTLSFASGKIISDILDEKNSKRFSFLEEEML